ncbi:MAG: sulfate ABC transporter substrate-binding protein, partial [Planctomycetaceae bacterium]
MLPPLAPVSPVVSRVLTAGLLLACLMALGCAGGSGAPPAGGGSPDAEVETTTPVTLLNVSYDPTRELYQELNGLYAAEAHKTGQKVTIRQSHGGSSSQARAVIDGLEADVVTLALWSDIDAIRAKGLIEPGWEDEFPNRSLPYFSTIVFLVRRGNPKQIHDWPDLVRPGIEIITPNPKTGGGAKLSLLAAWGSVTTRGGTTDEARAFVKQLYQQVPVLDSGARAATVTFVQKQIGDVYLAWENEAHLARLESAGELEIVYPPVSLRAEPMVALVDTVVDRRGTREAATGYLQFLYSPTAQEVIARRYFRPIDPEVLARHADQFPTLR